MSDRRNLRPLAQRTGEGSEARHVNVEVYELRLSPKAIHRSDPHAKGTVETIVVLTGALRVAIGDATYDLAAGDSVYFRADVAHSYENRSNREMRCIDVIHYERG